MKHLLKRNNKEISAYVRDKQFECCAFSIIQQPITMTQTKTFYFNEAETNKCLMQHCIVVSPKAGVKLTNIVGPT